MRYASQVLATQKDHFMLHKNTKLIYFFCRKLKFFKNMLKGVLLLTKILLLRIHM